MDNRREFPRIIVFNLGISFHTDEGEQFDVVNAADGGLCLKRRGAPKVSPGHPIAGRLSWPEKNIEKQLSGLVCWSRSVDDGDMFYGVHVDVIWLMDMLADGQYLEAGDETP